MAARTHLVGMPFTLSQGSGQEGKVSTIFLRVLSNPTEAVLETVQIDITLPQVFTPYSIFHAVKAGFSKDPRFKVFFRTYGGTTHRFIIFAYSDNFIFDLDPALNPEKEQNFYGLTTAQAFIRKNTRTKYGNVVGIRATSYGWSSWQLGQGSRTAGKLWFVQNSDYDNKIGFTGPFPNIGSVLDAKSVLQRLNSTSYTKGILFSQRSISNDRTYFAAEATSGIPALPDDQYLYSFYDFESSTWEKEDVAPLVGMGTVFQMNSIAEGQYPDNTYPLTDEEPAMPTSTYSYVMSGSFVQEDDLPAVRALGTCTLIFSEKETGEASYTSKTYTIKFPSNVIRNQIKAYIQHALGSKYKVLHKKVINNNGTDSGWLKWIIVGSEPTFKFTLTGGTARAALKFDANGYGYHQTNRDNATHAPARLYSQAGISPAGTNVISGNVRNGAGVTKSFTKAVPANSTPASIAALLNQDLGTDAKCYASDKTVFLQDGAYRSPGQQLSVTGSVPNAAGFAFPLSIPSYPAMTSSADGDFPVKSDVLPNETVVFTEVTSAIAQDVSPDMYVTRIIVSFTKPISSSSPVATSIFKFIAGSNSINIGKVAIVSGKLYCYISSQLDISIHAPYAITYTPTATNYLQDTSNDKVDAFNQSCTVAAADVTASNGTLLVFCNSNFSGQQDSLRITINNVEYVSPVLNFNRVFRTTLELIDALKAAWPALISVCDIFDATFYTAYTKTPLVLGVRPKTPVSFTPFVSLHNGGTYNGIMNLTSQIILSTDDVKNAQMISSVFSLDVAFPTTAQDMRAMIINRVSDFSLSSQQLFVSATFTRNEPPAGIASKINTSLGASTSLLQFEARTTEYGQNYILGVRKDISLGTCGLSSTKPTQTYPYTPLSIIANGIAISPLDYSDINYPVLESAALVLGAGVATITLYYNKLLRLTNANLSARTLYTAQDPAGTAVTLNTTLTLDTQDNKSIVVLKTTTAYTNTSIFLTFKCYATYALMSNDTPFYVVPPFQNLKIDVPPEPPALQSANINARTITLLYDKELSTTLVPGPGNFTIDVTK